MLWIEECLEERIDDGSSCRSEVSCSLIGFVLYDIVIALELEKGRNRCRIVYAVDGSGIIFFLFEEVLEIFHSSVILS